MTTPALSTRRPFLPEDITHDPPAAAFFRAVAARVIAEDGRSPSTIARQAWPRDEGVQIVLRAASGPADTSTSGWASQIVETSNAGWISSLRPSVFSAIAPLGLQLSLDNGLVRVPGRDVTPSIGGSFVAEGAPIPVRRLNANAVTLGPKKLGVITTMTDEVRRMSAPNAELVLRDEITADNAAAVDSVLLDATAASTIRPAGLRSYGAGLTPAAGGGATALTGDLKALLAAIQPASAPVLIMNPGQALSLALAGFAADSPMVIQNANVTVGTVIALDLASFVSASGAPLFSLSEEAVVHLEDTSPAQIGTAGSPNTVAAPSYSTFQSNLIALRVTWNVNWVVRRSNAVAWLQSTTW